MLNILHTLKAENNFFFIMGDFNINLLNYDHHTETCDYVDTMYSNAFLPLITVYQNNTNLSYINRQYLQQ